MIRYGLQWHALQDYLAFEETSNSGSWGLGGTGRPPANHVFLYGKDNGSGISTLCYKNDNNVEICFPVSGSIVTSSGGGVAGRVAFYDATLSLTGDADLTFATDTLSATKVAISTLTSGRVPFASTAGLLVDNATMTFTNPNLIIDSATADPGLFILGRNAGTSSPHIRFGDDSVANRFQIAMATGNTFFSAVALKNDGIIRTKTDSANMIFLLEGSSIGKFKWSSGGAAADTVKMTFDGSTARLGIGSGATSPASPLEIIDDQGSSNNLIRMTRYGGSATNPNVGFLIQAARNTLASPAAIAADDTIFRIVGFGYGNAFQANADVAIRLKAGELFTSSAHGTYITLETTPTGSLTIAERFRVGPAGQWGIGGATYGTSGNPYISGGSSAAPSWASAFIFDNSNKRLGINMTPTVDFEVTNTAAVPIFRIIGDRNVASMNAQMELRVHSNSNTNSGGIYRGTATRGSAGSPTATASGDLLTQLVGDGYTNALTTSGQAAIRMKAASLWTSSNAETKIEFDTTPNASTTPATALTIESSGDVSHASGVRLRMLSQNRTRFLNTGCSASSSAATTIADSTWTSIALAAADHFDNDSCHDTVTNNTRLTVKLTGKYVLMGQSDFQANATGQRLIRIALNGAGTNIVDSGAQVATSAVHQGLVCCGIYNLTANDYVELQAFQSSGGNLSNHQNIVSKLIAMYIGE